MRIAIGCQLSLQDVPVKTKKMQYDRANLFRAFEATQRGVSVYRAARDYSVPQQTLRDRVDGLVDLDVKIGFDTIFNIEEEEKLVGHITYMADFGYGYGASGIRYMAKDFADFLGKHVKAKEALSNNWFYSCFEDMAKSESYQTTEAQCHKSQVSIKRNPSQVL